MVSVLGSWLVVFSGGVLRAQSVPEINTPQPEVARLIAAATELEAVDAKEGLVLAARALESARDPATRLKAQLVHASILRRLGNYVDAMRGAEAGLKQAEALGAERTMAEFLYLIGRIQWSLADYASSIATHHQQLAWAREAQDALQLSKAHTGLGLTMESFGDPTMAAEHLTEALRWAEQAADSRQLAIVLNSLGNHYLGGHDLELATGYHERALALRRQSGSVRGIADSLNNLALIAHEKGRSEQALALLNEARVIYERLDLKRYVANVHRRIGAILREVGRLEESRSHLEAGIEVGEPLGSGEVMGNLYDELARTQEALGNLDLALEYERKRAAVIEEARNVEARERVAELNARYEAERREHEIDLLRRDQALQTAEFGRRRLLMIFTATGLAVLAIGLVVAVWLQRVRLREERRVLALTEDARDRAEEAEELKSRLLRIASHDLKSPLATLRATASRIERESAPESLVARLATGMRVDATRMDLLVHDLLDSVAMDDNVFTLHVTRFSLRALCEEILEHLQSVALGKAQVLRLSTSDTLTPLEADRDRLWQILDNLLSNALKFAPRGGSIELRLSEVPNWFSIEVADDGPGLQPSDMVRVFGPYERLSAKPTGGEHSSGLGLHITRELVSLHRGRLEVESQPGRGAIFRVLLPSNGSTQTTLQTPADERGNVVQA